MTRRVVITGLGTVNPLMFDLPGFWSALCAGKSGIGPIEWFDTTKFKVKFGGEIRGWQPEKYIDKRTAKHLDRFAQFALAAAVNAVKDSGLDLPSEDPTRCGVIVGSGIGGLSEFEEQHSRLEKDGPGRLSPFMIPKMIANSAAGIISIEFGLRGPNTSVTTACASAGNAISDAHRAIQYGLADVMVSGGAEAALTPMGLGGFIAARAVSLRNDNPTAASRPFDKDRDGFVLSEGAGIVVLEEFERARKSQCSHLRRTARLGQFRRCLPHHGTAPRGCRCGPGHEGRSQGRPAQPGGRPVHQRTRHQYPAWR